jgi:hypothetical protein
MKVKWTVKLGRIVCVHWAVNGDKVLEIKAEAQE